MIIASSAQPGRPIRVVQPAHRPAVQFGASSPKNEPKEELKWEIPKKKAFRNLKIILATLSLSGFGTGIVSSLIGIGSSMEKTRQSDILQAYSEKISEISKKKIEQCASEINLAQSKGLVKSEIERCGSEMRIDFLNTYFDSRENQREKPRINTLILMSFIFAFMTSPMFLLTLLGERGSAPRARDRRMKAILAHEAGHAIVNKEMTERIRHTLAQEHPARPAIRISPSWEQTSFAIFEHLQNRNGAAYRPEAWCKSYRDLDDRVNKALLNKEFYAPELDDLRAEFMEYNKQSAMICAAGCMLDEYIHGDVLTNGAGDEATMNGSIGNMVLCIRPVEDWEPDELENFINQQREEIIRDTHALFKSLDRGAVQEVYETLVEQANAGKREWTFGELEPLLRKLDQPPRQGVAKSGSNQYGSNSQ